MLRTVIAADYLFKNILHFATVFLSRTIVSDAIHNLFNNLIHFATPTLRLIASDDLYLLSNNLLHFATC